MRYFIATYYRKPNGKYSEQVKTDTKVRNKDLTGASIILDYKERKVVKSNFGDTIEERRDFEKINEFYKNHYSNLIAQLEAKYEVLDAALELAKEIVDKSEAKEVSEKLEEIAK